jgi:uncharacterized membrane protein SirB2
MKKKTKTWGDSGNVKKIERILYLLLFILVGVDFFVHKHAEFVWENLPGFFAAYGILSCIVLVFAAKLLGNVTKRNERYYD